MIKYLLEVIRKGLSSCKHFSNKPVSNLNFLVSYINKDKVTLLVSLSVLFTFAISFIPSFNLPIGEGEQITIKKMDLISELFSSVDKKNVNAEQPVLTATEAPEQPSAPIETPNEHSTVAVEKETATQISNREETPKRAPIKGGGPVVPFENYSDTDELQTLAEKFRQAGKGRRSVRIAFVGDSFIESDIMTADVRTLLQSQFGGNGVGFVPVSSVASKYRLTINHTFEGWKTYSMVKYNKSNWDKLHLSGYYFEPQENANFFVELSNKKGAGTPVSSAKFMFINKNATHIESTVNGDRNNSYTPKPKEGLQMLALDGEIHSLKMSFKQVEGFTAYGVFMNDSTGVYVDNYSVRGSSGIVLSTANKELCSQLNDMIHYDLIVLQYGLNVVSADVTNYNYYEKTMINVVNTLKSYFPNSTFMVMGVADRAMKCNNSFETMPGILSLINVQRKIAKSTHSLFWDTFQAMGGKNSILSFVGHTPPLANKDYTHINHAGGKRIAHSFVKAMMQEIDKDTPSGINGGTSNE